MPTSPTRATLLHCLAHWEQQQPHAVYLTQPTALGRTVDYRWSEIGHQVRRVAAYLRRLSLPPRSHVALLGQNSAHWIMADLAIWMAGHVSVPLYPTLNGETARYVLDHSEARLLFLGKMNERWSLVTSGVPENIPRIALPLAPFADAPTWDDIVAATAPLAEVPERAGEELATIIYTSGSTGRPKGVMISFGGMMATALGLTQVLPVTRADRMLSYLPLAHAAERAMVETLSLYHGCRVYFAHSLDTFLDDLRRARPTLFFSVPRLWTKFHLRISEKLPPVRQKMLFRLPVVSRVVKKAILKKLGLEHVRAAVTGSAPLAPDLIAWYRDLGLELLEGYAMSENFCYSHSNRPGRTRLGWVGHAHPGVECRIAENGEVLVKSPATMMGYYKDADATVQHLTADGFLRTGDLGELDAEGCLKITGRVKELFKTSKGKYVAPAPIENRLGTHPAIEAVCVTGPGQPQPFGLVLLSTEPRVRSGKHADPSLVAADLRALMEEVNAGLEEHERLDYLVVVREQWLMDSGFLTPTLKIRRSAIEAHYLPQADAWRARGEKVIWG